MSVDGSHRLGKSDLVWLAGLAVLAVGLFLVSIPWGIGVRPDSAYYLSFPIYLHGNSPAYVWAIQIVSALGPSELVAATVLNVTFLALNVALVYALVRCFGASRLISAIAGLLVLSSPLVFELHVTVLSEAMFIFLLLVSLTLLSLYARSQIVTYLLAAALVAVLLFLTRFNGAPVWVVGLLTALFLGPKNTKMKLAHVTAYLTALALPVLVWTIVEAQTSGTGLGREFGLYGNPTLAILMQGANSIWVSFFPSFVPSFVKVITALLLIAFLATIVWQQTRKQMAGPQSEGGNALAAFPLIVAVYIFGHFALLLVSLVIEANLPLKPSYFAPVYVLLVIIGAQYTTLLRAGLGRVLGLGLMVFGTLVFASNLVRTGTLVGEYREEGIFFSGPKWYDSPLAAEIGTLDADIIVYSNAPDVIHYLTGHNAQWLPMKLNRRTGEPFPDRPYDVLLAEMNDDLTQGKAVLAFFDDVTWRFYLPTQHELIRDLNLSELARTEDGILLHRTAN